MGKPARNHCAGRAGAVAACMAILCVAAGLHSEPPPVPPGPPKTIATERLEPPRWAWHHWWEINRERFVVDLRQRADGQLPDQDELARLKADAALALSAMLADPSVDDAVRSKASIALARMGEQPAFRDMLVLAENRDGWIGHACTLGLGLLDMPTSEPTLIQLDIDVDDEQADHAAVVSIGMLSALTDPKADDGLRHYMSGDWGPQLASAAALSFTQTADSTDTRQVVDILQDQSNPWTAAPLLEWLGRAAPARRPNRSVTLIRGVLHDDERTPIGAVTQLREWKNERSRHLYLAANAPNIVIQKQWADKLDGIVLVIGDAVPTWGARQTGPWYSLGFEEIQTANLRASAAVGLGHIDHPSARIALLDSLDLPDDDYSDVWKGAAIMALAESEPIDKPVARDAMWEIFSPDTTRGTRKSHLQFDSPLRGFAAIGLGLYCRPVDGPQGISSRPQWEKVAELLAERAIDERENTEVRAASIVALGLTARTESLRYLQRIDELIAADDKLLKGYLFLARGLLGDMNMLEPVEVFLNPATDETDVESILAKRAAVLGVGALRTDEAIPVLTQAWDLNYWVNREVILALRICDAVSVAPALVNLLENGPTVYSQTFAAEALGTLFNREDPDRLAARLLHRRNFRMRHHSLEPYRAEANVFFYDYLAHQLGGDWY